MKTKQPASSKKQPVILKDLTTKKNPKGGANNLKLASLASTPCAPLTALVTVTARWGKA